METVKVEHLNDGSESTGDGGGGDVDGMSVSNLNGGETFGSSGGETDVTEDHVPQAITAEINGQLEIEIPAGESREGAIHTIQLQSPGGNTHIVEGLVVTSAGGVAGGEEGETTAIFHPGAAGLTSQTCEVITADPSEHHILSGLQVVRVTSGTSGETIFLVPSTTATGGDKDTMQQVMLLQSTGSAVGDKDGMQQVMVIQPTPTEEMQEDPIQVAQEVVEESVEINIPSPKPVLTTVKQEMAGNGRESVVVAETLQQHYQHQQQNTTLVVVTGSTPTTHTTSCSDVKPTVSTLEGKQITISSSSTTSPSKIQKSPIISNGPSIADDRPKRKAALKAVATRKAALASASPRKHNTAPKSPKKSKMEPKVIEVKGKSPSTTNNSHLPINTSTPIQTPPSSGLIGSTPRNLFSIPPPPPVVTQPAHKIIVTGASTSTSKNYFLLPEDLVSDSDDEGDGSLPRKCVVCLRKKRFTEDIFESGPDMSNGGPHTTSPKQQPRLLPHMDVLITHLNIPARGKANEVGICLPCLDSLQRWHIFNCAVVKRHEDAKGGALSAENAPLNLEPFETRIYRNCKKMGKVMEVYNSATHSHFARRLLTKKDWDYFCEHLFRSSSARSEKARALERYITCREKLSHIYCIKCQRLVRNGKKGFIKHMKTHHPHQPILFPCDICGSHLPEKGFGASNEDYYPHWISHFFFNTCEECGKRFPTKRSLGQHRQSVHKNRVPNWGAHVDDSSSNEDRHRDMVQLNVKNHVCNICGEAFKSTSSLRGHVRRHEGRRDYKCEVCHKEYYTYSALKGHKVVHQTARDFICGVCGKAFKKKKALEEHGTLHTGVKQHRCNICGREIRVKSNLYKHMKIHKKNAELGITSGRGRNLGLNRSNSTTISSNTSTTQQVSDSPVKTSSTPTVGRGRGEPRVKQIKVEDRILEIKQEPMITHFQQQSSSGLPSTATSSSPLQATTAVDVVLENARVDEHRVPIVVSIVGDGLTGPDGTLQLSNEQHGQLLSAIQSFAGHSVTLSGGGSGPASFLTSHLPSSSSNGTSVVSTTSSSSGQDPILGVYNAQQFFTTLDQLQN